MRTLRRTKEFDEFYNSVIPKVQEKIDYALNLMPQIAENILSELAK